jgi:adenylyltransferase/sulfurtransferase
MGSLQALQAIKVVLNIGEQLVGKLMMIDALDLTFRSIKINKDSACKICQ